jgi:hypothetical protein
MLTKAWLFVSSVQICQTHFNIIPLCFEVFRKDYYISHPSWPNRPKKDLGVQHHSKLHVHAHVDYSLFQSVRLLDLTLTITFSFTNAVCNTDLDRNLSMPQL